MVFIKKAVRNKKLGKQARNYRRFKRSKVFMNKRFSPSKIYSYKYTITKGTVGIANGANSNYNGISFKLQDIPNYTELTTLYDEYRITRVTIILMPRSASLGQTNSASSGNVNQQYSNVQPFITVIDYDDATPPGARSDLIQYGTAKQHLPNRMIRRTLQPCVAVQTYKTAVSSGYMAKRRQWLDCADDTVPHYGFKWAYNQDSAAAADTVLYDITCVYYVQCRGTR